MIHFVDGPAEGTRLNLARAPYFLRVVIQPLGAVDALDQLDDEPLPGESIHVYRMVGEPSFVIACSRGKNGGCRRMTIAEYRLHECQPEHAVARDREQWSRWAEEEYARVNPPRLRGSA
jgi:hypothetical protein